MAQSGVDEIFGFLCAGWPPACAATRDIAAATRDIAAATRNIVAASRACNVPLEINSSGFFHPWIPDGFASSRIPNS